MIVILLCLLCTAHEVCLLHTEHTEMSIDDYIRDYTLCTNSNHEVKLR